MKKLFTVILVCIAFQGLAQQEKVPESKIAFTGINTGWIQPEVKSLTGSYVEFDPLVGGVECFLPGISQDFIFKAGSFSPDWEYAYYVWLNFPTNWVINNVYVEGTPSCISDGYFGSFSFEVLDPPNTVRIYHPRFHSSTGDNCIAHYKVGITPTLADSDAEVSWYWNGDGWGAAPYNPCSNDGYTPSGETACDEMIYPVALIPACATEPGVYITPPDQTKYGCPGFKEDYIVTILNFTGEAETFELNYEIIEGNGIVSGPSEIMLEENENQNITVSMVSDIGLDGGDIVKASIEASGGGYSDMVNITKIIAIDEWINIATEPHSGRMDNVLVTHNDLIWSITGYTSNDLVRYYDPKADIWTEVGGSNFPSNYARSGASYGSKAFIYGDASGFLGLWSYDMDENVWTNETPAGTAPAQTGIWAPAWVADPETGYLYITGGAINPGGGDLTTVYVYDPENNEWLDPLPNFNSERAFHAAFIFNHPVTGHKMLAVAGGVNVSSVALKSTQCYDFVTNQWNEENADIPELPYVIWGMGYAHNIIKENSQLWLVAGADASFDPLPNSLYYDVNADEWIDGGIYHVSPVYRNSAIALDGNVYKIGGATSGFTTTGLSSKFVTCKYPPEISVYPVSMDQFVEFQSMAEQTLTITNTGETTLEFSSISYLDLDTKTAKQLEPLSDLELGQIHAISDNHPEKIMVARDDYIRFNKGKGSLIQPKIIIYEDIATNPWYTKALNDLGLAYASVNSFSSLATALNSDINYNLVIINSYSDEFLDNIYNHLVDHLDTGGKMIFAHWNKVDFENTSFSELMGIDVISDFFEPKNFSLTTEGEIIVIPHNLVDDYNWVYDQWNRDGQIVETLDGATRLAVFEGYPNSAAIVLNEQMNCIFNAFQADNYSGDTNDSGKDDIQELIENQISYFCNMIVFPSYGTLHAGESMDATVYFNSHNHDTGNYSGEITIHSNDPLVPEFTVPVTARFRGLLYTLSVAVNPVGAGTVTGEGLFEADDEVMLTATANEGYKFVNWTDAGQLEVSIHESCSYIMPAFATTVTANFSETTAIAEEIMDGIIIYPNPARDKLTVESVDKIHQIRIVSITGQIINDMAVDAFSYELSVSSLNKGMYFIQIHTTNNVVTQRVQVIK